MFAPAGQSSADQFCAAFDVKEWVKTDLEGFDAIMDNGTEEGLYVLVEKDWQCLTPRDEDESDLFPNPNA